MLTVTAASAADQSRALVDRLPRTANAVVILNMEKAKNSAMGKREDWSARVERAFDAGLSRVPPMASRIVMAAELDFTTMQPAWEVAVMDVPQPLCMDNIIKQRRGVKDTIELLPAVAVVNNVYVVQFGPTTIGAMGPANRRNMTPWIRDAVPPSAVAVPGEGSPLLGHRGHRDYYGGRSVCERFAEAVQFKVLGASRLPGGCCPGNESVTNDGLFTKEKRMRQVMLTVAVMAWGLASAMGADANRQAADEAAIRKSVESYVAAFNKGDAKALAAMWAPEAVYTNPLSGEQVVGRAEIEKQFAGIFAAAKNTKLEAKTDSIQFLSPNVAVEHGTAKVIRPEQAPEESEYTAVYVKRDGQWLLDRVTEEDVPVVTSQYEQLKELEWMVGRWVDQDDDATVVTECNWTRNNNFLTRSFTVQIRDRLDMAGMQIIGWDPATKQIRSWVFDSDGGFGQGTWKKKGKRWYIQQSGVLPDGRKSSSVNIITYVDDKTCTLQSVNRMVDGELLPNVEEVKIVKE